MRAFVLGVVLLASVVALGCGSEQSKEDRGLVVDREEAVPGNAAELDETEAERRQQLNAEDDAAEDAEFERSQTAD